MADKKYEPLNTKQELFCQNYRLNNNATAAARAAGYSSGSAHTQGSRLMAREEIQDRIAELEQDMETSINVVEESLGASVQVTDGSRYRRT